MRFARNFIALAFLAAAGVTASAQSAFDPAADDAAPRNRADVRAETRVAVAAGRIPRGETAPEFPSRFFTTRTREEVNAQAASALAAGLIARGESTPDPAVTFASTKTRVQVLAEAREALRLDLIPRGEAPIPVASAGQRESIRIAGLRVRAEREILATR